MSNGSPDRSTAALLRAESRAIGRLASLRGEVVDLLGLLNRAMPRLTATRRSDTRNLVSLDRTHRREGK